jgi:hypothetical protein
MALVEQHGTKRWSLIAGQINGRLGKQCRERCVRGGCGCVGWRDSCARAAADVV